jgi:acetyl esterase/lipase
MKILANLILCLFCMSVSAQNKVVRLYEGPAPGSENWKQQEKENNNNAWQTRIVYNVAQPTLTVFPPDPAEEANGTAVVIAPGGAFHALSIDSEGFDVARWLNSKGVTCFVLKYRLVESKTDDPVKELQAKGPKGIQEAAPVILLAAADGLKAVEHVRSRAKEYNVNPDRVGIIGFSAGGTVAASVAYNYTAASRPNFVAPIYLYYAPGLKKDVPADAPPMFILAATDDQLGLAPHSISLYNDWTAAKKPAELHLYSKGGHGFGMRKQNLPSDGWISLFADWLGAQGLLKK